MRRIRYVEQDMQGNIVTVTISTDLAIQYQKKCAVLNNCSYINDEEALIDYMNIHWACLEGEG